MQFLIILTVLPCLLQAELLQRTLDILEHGTSYTQVTTFDFAQRILTIDVPAHNDIVQSRSIFDYNQGIMVEAHPWSQHCYLKDMPENMATMEQMLKGLSKREREPVNATAAKVVRKLFGHYKEIHLTEMGSDKLIEECKDYSVFRVFEDANLPERYEEYSRGHPADIFSTENPGCDFHSQCVWQSCHYGSDSCYWTVNCEPTPDPEKPNCDDVIHNSNFHGPNGNPISCTACFNTQCSGPGYDCAKDWVNQCDSGAALGNKLEECPNDADLGNDCGEYLRCAPPGSFPPEQWKGNNCGSNEPGTFDCPQDKDHLEYVMDGNVCMFNHGDRPGGYVMCKDGEFVDSTSC